MSSGITADEIIARIRSGLGIEWLDQTTDFIKAGRGSTIVRGIATTAWSTLDVLEQAVARGKNLVISHEATFWNEADRPDAFPGAVLATTKQAFIDDHDVVVFRFHDHWHLRQPDAFWEGLGRALGWSAFASLPPRYGEQLMEWESHPRRQATYRVPRMTLRELVVAIERTLGIGTVRAIGRPDLGVEEVALSPGFCSTEWVIDALERADVLVVGECREWEGIEYARDLVHSGAAKGLVVIGHAASEDPGMSECAEWLRGLVPEVPVEFIPAGEPFWRPHQHSDAGANRNG